MYVVSRFALPHADAARFEAHLAECRGCEAYLEQVRTTIAVTRASGVLDEQPDVAPLLDAFRHWRRRV